MRIFLQLIVVLGGLLLFTHQAQAAFVTSLYVKEVAVAPGGSIIIDWAAIQGVFPYTCSISRSDGSFVRSHWTIDSAIGERGEFSTTPDETTTYTLVCTDGAGVEKRDSDSITVSDKPVVTISSNPTTLPADGGSVYIRWTVGLATSCTTSGGTEAWRSLKGTHTGGNLSYALIKSTTFSIECFDAAGRSSGKKSVKVGVGEGSNICGNGVEEPGEECDLGTNGNGVCPLKCSTSCESNGCSSVVTITMNASPSEYDPGDDVKISWSAKNAVRCDAARGEGFAGTTIGTSGNVTVYPTKNSQNYEVECYDSGGLSARESVSVSIDVDYDLDIISFTASPNPVPFGYEGAVSFSYKTKVSPAESKPICKLGSETSRGWVAKGTSLKSTRGTIELPVEQVSTNAPEAGPGGKRMGIKCNISDGTYDGLSDYADTLIRFESDPDQAPAVSLSVGKGNDRTLDGAVTSGTSVEVYRGVSGAERCEWMDSRSGTSSLPPFVGEQKFDTTITETTTFALECWNGTLSNKAEFTVTVTSTQPPGQGQGPGGTTPDPTAPGGGGTTPSSIPVTTVTAGLPVIFQNPLTFTSINDLLAALLFSLQNIIVVLALIFIIIGAFLYITSGGNDHRMELGKKAILAALIGLALGIAAPAFFREIASILGWTEVNTPAGVGTSLSLLQIANNVLSFLLTIIGILAIIMLVIGGIMYLTAAGNEDQIDRGKKIVKYSIIGILIALASLVLVKQVAGFFS